MVTKEKTKAKTKVARSASIMGSSFSLAHQAAMKAKDMGVEKKLTPMEKKLAEQGLHTRYEHYRFDDRSAITACNLENVEKVPVAVGFAVCSHKDNFCRATGREYSMKRAFAALSAKRNLFPLEHRHNGSNEAMGNFSAQYEYMAQYMTLNLGS